MYTFCTHTEARPDVGNSSGETPVHWAAKASNVTALDAMTRLLSLLLLAV